MSIFPGMVEMEVRVNQCVTDCTWLARRGKTEVALDMRADFCREWQVDVGLWNEQVDELLDYVERRGETPEISRRQLLSIRYGVEGIDLG